jgi:hypothetical protein
MSGIGGKLRRSVAATAAAIVALGAVATADTPNLPPYLSKFPDFSAKLTPAMPGDVDIALKQTLEGKQLFPQVQREFDLWSWQAFISLMWPTDNAGKPAPRFTDTGFGAPHWTLWNNSASIFQTDGSTPAACGQPTLRALAIHRDLSHPVSKGLAAFSVAATQGVNPRTTRFLGVISAVGELNVSKLSEISQAFSGPLIDQNGNFVFYEIMIDPNEVGYLCDNSLYNINGQIAFSGGNGHVQMPSGTPQTDWSGSFELKLAWKVLTGKDDPSRFYTQAAVIMDQGPDGKPVERHVTVGLVGMHIGHKSETSPQWIWATFEQIDNIAVDQVSHPNVNPSFADLNCPICAVNLQPQPNANGVYPRIPTQVWRSIPIPPDKVALNGQAEAELAKLGSVFQYYELIDTQWPTQPNNPPTPWNGPLPGAVANKPGGDPTPVFLTNVTMETYFQGGSEPACNAEELPNGVACPPPTPNWTSPMNAKGGPAPSTQNVNVFASESCMGCHSSAGIWTSYNPATQQGNQAGQLTADFSWLLTQKANYKQ